MLKRLSYSLLVVGSSLSFNVMALNIEQAYQDAMQHSFYLKAQNAERLANRSLSNKAYSLWLPQVSVDGFLNHGNFNIDGASTAANYDGVDIIVRQTLFDYAKIAKTIGSKYVKSLADVGYQINKQQLTKKVIKAYYHVLLLHHLLSLAQLKQRLVKTALYQVRVADKLKLKTGDQVAYIESDYDDAIAEKLKAQAYYSDAIAQLDRLVGHRVASLYTLRSHVMTRIPQPPCLAVWERRARLHNNKIKALELAERIAQQNVGVAEAGFMPSLNAYASYNVVHNKGVLMNDGRVLGEATGGRRIRGYAVGLSASLPLFSGGATMMGSRAAEHMLERAQYSLDEAHADITLATRNDYLMLRTDNEKIKAQLRAVKANKLALHLATLEMNAHTKTQFDVMTIKSKLMLSHVHYLTAVFDYMQRYVDLKADTGTLNQYVIYELNQYLSKQHLVLSKHDRFPI